MWRALLVIAAAFGAFVVVARPAYACSCAPFTPVQLAAEAEVVFTGLARADLGSVGRGLDHYRVLEFGVETVYKGALASTTRIQAVGGDGAMCGYEFRLGRRYTVFARDYDGDGTANTNLCFQNVEGMITPSAYGLPAGTELAGGDQRAATMVALAALGIFAALALGLERRFSA